MRTNRRGFLRVLGSTLAFLSGGPTFGCAQERVSEIHQATRNTGFGAWGVRPRRLATQASPFKPYPGAKREKFPSTARQAVLPLTEAVRSYVPASGFRSTTLSAGQLGRILYLTNGVTGEVRGSEGTTYLRAAPSAGALYAGEVYVVAERVGGLSSGIYYYGVRDHELVELRLGSFLDEVGQALERPGEIENCAAVILITNVFHRYASRYANRGYRYALIDTGHIGENLRLAAVSAGFGETAPFRFHDVLLNSLLQVDGREEAVCAVHAVGEPGNSATRPQLVNRFVEEQHAAVRAVPRKGPVTERYHQATKLVPGDAGENRSVYGESDAPASGSGQVLTKSRTPPMTAVEDTIRERRSAERFWPEPVALGDLSFVLEMAQRHAPLQRAAGVDLYLAAHRVSEVDPGLYRYQPEAHGLTLVRQSDLTRPMTHACLGQEKAGTAAAGVLMVARLAEAASRTGDRSYRDLLLESGGIGQRLYLAAEAAGLVARNLAAFVDDEINHLVGLDGRLEAVIHLTMLGHGR